MAFLQETTGAFLEHCRETGVRQATLVSPILLRPGGIDEAAGAIAASGVRIASINHPFAVYPDLELDRGQAEATLQTVIGFAEDIEAPTVYLLTGARGELTWEQAAERFGELIAPCVARAAAGGVRLLVENASAFNADIHIAHTLADTITLADYAGVGVCIDVHACWAEARLSDLLRRAMPLTGMIQLSDYVLGDRSAPCRAVPGDGAIPLKRIIADALADGYDGTFDIELVGPRIDEEGPRSATARAAQRVSDMLTELGA
ncbi:MAG: sugar phosphate isomerase/epimerase family protein [Microbacteriaceae bacterium]